MIKYSFLLILTVLIFTDFNKGDTVSGSEKKNDSVAVKKEVVENIWVCRNFSGGLQCVDDKELETNKSKQIPTEKSPLLSSMSEDVTYQNAREKLIKEGVTVLEAEKFNNPVCRACFVCPKYSIDLCFKVKPEDVGTAQKLGFNKKEINQ